MSSVTVFLKEDYVFKKMKGHPVRLRVMLEGVKKELTVKGVRVEKHFWDFKNNRIKAKHQEADDLNLIINNLYTSVHEILKKYRISDKVLTIELLTAELKNPAVRHDFYRWFLREIDERFACGEIRESTRTLHISQVSKLKAFKKNLTFTQISEKLLNGYKKYMINTLQNKPATIHKTFRTLKTYVRIAHKRELLQKNPFDVYQLKAVKTVPFALTEVERDQLKDLYENGTLNFNFQNTLRAFLFLCYTGLRYADFESLSVDEILIISKRKTIVKEMQKTGDEVRVPLHDFALKLMKDETKGLKTNGVIFTSQQCHQQMNLQIKHICRVAGIEPKRAKKVSLHKARHTFATLALRMSDRGDGILHVAKLLGHRSPRTTEVYLDVYENDTTNLIDKL